MSHSLINAQDIPNEGKDNNATVVDSIDYGENLLDSNAVYKMQFDSLSEDGEWIKMDKAEFVRAISAETGENLESEYPHTTEIIYVWRPYYSDYGWNPYTNGRWVFTSYGWAWMSNYDWGWGPYNYGRWYCSNLYGWTWIPGCRWAANWVTWRHHNQYVGWYPTCPRIFWNVVGIIYSNNLFASVPANWTFVKKSDFTKNIDNTTIADTKFNGDILKNSGKIKTSVYVDPGMPKFKYAGPEVNDISNETGEKIYPKQVNVLNTNERSYVEEKNTSIYEGKTSRAVKEVNTKTNTRDNGYENNTKEDNSGNTQTRGNKTTKDSGTKKIKAKNKGTRSYEGSNESSPVKINTGSTESNSGKTNDESNRNTNENVKMDSNGNSDLKDNNKK